ARCMAARIALSSGLCANLTYTRVPPRKSTPYGIPCQKSMENRPATLKTSENARKYHFLPRKSMFGFRKNSTLYPKEISFKVSGFKPRLTNAQCRATLFAVEDVVEDHARYENRGEQVRQQTEGQGNGKAL